METLVYNCQNLDLKINKALIMIQEIELVSRGYRLYPLYYIIIILLDNKIRMFHSTIIFNNILTIY
jgi:hypothetical protein